MRKCKFISTNIHFDRTHCVFIRPINSKSDYQIICNNCDNIMCFTDLTSENKPLYLKGSNNFTYDKGSNYVTSDERETAIKFNNTANFYNNDIIYLDGDENAYLYLDGRRVGTNGTYSKIKTIISKNIIISFRTNSIWNGDVYAIGVEELTNITCDRSFIDCYINCYTKLTSDSINNLISHLIDNTNSNIASIRLTRAQYNLLTADNVQNALNLNYEFNILN